MRKEVVVATAVATVAVAGVVLVRWRKRDERRWRQTQRILRKFAKDCATPVPKLWHVAFDLVSDMQTSLSDQSQTDFVMHPCYTSSLPHGNEEGLYYGVNLREDNFLMLRARLSGKSEPITDMEREEVLIPPEVISGSTKDVFDFIALKLAIFITTNAKENPIAPKGKLGFTVSFPLLEGPASPTKGNVIRWKSFAVNDAAGKELANEVNAALEKHGIDLQVSALVDATIGDLAGGRYFNKACVAAVTLGLATNAVYVESAHVIPNGNEFKLSEMVIDMQWGNFNTPHLPITEFDMALDSESTNPGSRMFEKLIGGMYLGEVVRRVLLKMAKETAIFGETVPSKLKTPYTLRSPDMAAMHQDTTENRDTVQEKLLEVFGIASSTPSVREIVAEICDIVAERGARLAGACIVGIMKKRGRINEKKSVVKVEGGLYEHYRVFRNYLHSSVWEMLGNSLADNVMIENSHGGSGAGAIFVAAAHSHVHESITPPFSQRNSTVDQLEMRDDHQMASKVGTGQNETAEDDSIFWNDQMESTAETSDQSGSGSSEE
ncbi:probable hexokinase-like 2 protein [Cynara cardunculus var. scolymus]|uniref:probable hexokinase-like 2 protein n=1 Tax=Cynara cardunculus var. scolymus TaxID=59895 RepID=UPI000D62BD67|nr:probable hexokinase-like 2 protein [Cynara cardunculus var. scolymus]